MGFPVLAHDTRRISGKDVIKKNVESIKKASSFLRTALGPRGTVKLVVQTKNSFIISSSGSILISSLKGENPAFKVIKEVATSQKKKFSDGVKTTIILIGELLKNAEKLIEKKVHPNIIIKGYNEALKETIKILKNLSVPVNLENTKILNQVAKTAINNIFLSHSSLKGKFSKMAVKTVKHVVERQNGDWKLDKRRILTVRLKGKNLFYSKLIRGVVLRKNTPHLRTPKKVENAKIAILGEGIEATLKDRFGSSLIKILNDFTKVNIFLRDEYNRLQTAIKRILDLNVNVVFSSGGIDDRALHMMVKEGIIGVRDLNREDIEKVLIVTGGKIININEISPDCLGKAESLEFKRVNPSDEYLLIKNKESKIVTLLLRGGNSYLIDEVEKNFLGAVNAVFESIKGGVVGGGGAIEVEIAEKLRSHAKSVTGLEQLAIKAFADSIEVIPIVLAENTGLDPLETICELRSKHALGQKWMGINTFEEKISDTMKVGILDPTNIKIHTFKIAKEVATLILRVDDLILSKKFEEEEVLPKAKKLLAEKEVEVPILIEKTEETY